MRKSIAKEFGKHKPQAAILDDSAKARTMTARKLKGRGFEAYEYPDVDTFLSEWTPGTLDVIVADWDLSHDVRKHGDQVLLEVRRRDWDVPFILVSGKLDQDAKRSAILESLLQGGSARFVRRGEGAISEICDLAEDLIERRDLALLKLILALRNGALSGAKITTSAGEELASEILASIVAKPEASHDAGRPIAKNLSAATKKT